MPLKRPVRLAHGQNRAPIWVFAGWGRSIFVFGKGLLSPAGMLLLPTVPLLRSVELEFRRISNSVRLDLVSAGIYTDSSGSPGNLVGGAESSCTVGESVVPLR